MHSGWQWKKTSFSIISAYHTCHSEGVNNYCKLKREFVSDNIYEANLTLDKRSCQGGGMKKVGMRRE